MRYHDKPTGFPWRSWGNLWCNNLADLASTKDLAPNTIFVAIDTEPWLSEDARNIDNRQAREIGLAVLLPATDAEKRSPEPPRSLEEAVERFSISASSIRIRGRQRRSIRIERVCNAFPEPIINVEPEDVEATVVNILTKAQGSSIASQGSPRSLILVGFDLFAEFRVLSDQYPRVLACFTSWVDVQELAIADASLQGPPSLRTTLVGYGYEACWPTTQARSDGHNAGNDAVRTICVLIILLYFEPPGEALRATFTKHVAGLSKQKQLRLCDQFNVKPADVFDRNFPRPRHKYPFQVKVKLPVTSSSEAPTSLELCEYFLQFKPVAVGTGRRRDLGGGICLASLEEMNAFIEKVHGMEDSGGRGTWTAVSLYNPQNGPATTAAELEDFLAEKRAADIAEKRRLRRLAKLDKIYAGLYDDDSDESADGPALTQSTGY